ncbi:MAG: hypothetical protein JJ863_38055 [Deltaproteobacteria bacterium]|nr:hypothetical protein [Deltaproteobacteria bacterium]
MTLRGSIGRALGLLAFFVPMAMPSGAWAWTDAQVHGADADVVLSPDGRAEVTLSLSLRVRGGWLEGLEIAGLEPDAQLIEDPRMVSVPGEGETLERFHPRASVREPRGDDPDARIQLSFHRRESPRRGRYRIEVRYSTDLGSRLMPREDGDGWKGEWTLPAWRSGLDGVTITLRLPRGATFDPDAPPRALVERERSSEGGLTVLRWDRAHLPRTTPWPLRFELPAGSLDPALAERLRVGAPVDSEEANAGSVPTPGTTTIPRSAPAPFEMPPWLPLALALAMLVTGALFEREARRRRARPRPLVGSLLLRLALMALLVGLDAAFGLGPIARVCVLFAIALVGWQRSAEPAAPRPGRWARLDPGAPIAGGPSLTHAALAVGVLFVVGGALAMGDPLQPSWAVLALVAPLLHGGARRLPPTLEARRGALLDLAAALRAPLEAEASLALVGHHDEDGIGDVRLRWSLARPRPGIHRLDLVLTDERGPGGLLRKARLLVVTDAGSVAERHMERTAPVPEAGPTRLPGRRVMRLYRIGSVGAVLTLLAHDEVVELARAA